jgi:hypothetical protein
MEIIGNIINQIQLQCNQLIAELRSVRGNISIHLSLMLSVMD